MHLVHAMQSDKHPTENVQKTLNTSLATVKWCKAQTANSTSYHHALLRVKGGLYTEKCEAINNTFYIMQCVHDDRMVASACCSNFHVSPQENQRRNFILLYIQNRRLWRRTDAFGLSMLNEPERSEVISSRLQNNRNNAWNSEDTTAVPSGRAE